MSCYIYTMRYHKASEITKSEADLVVATTSISVTDTVVISHGEKWYDVRSMTWDEIEDFVADLARAEIAAEEATMSLPN